MTSDNPIDALTLQLVEFLVTRSTQAGDIFDGMPLPLLNLSQQQYDLAVVAAQHRITTYHPGGIDASSMKDITNFPPTEDLISGREDSKRFVTCFENNAQAEGYISSLAQIDRSGHKDDNIPQTQEQKRAIVGMLKQAICSTAVVPNDTAGHQIRKLIEGQLDPRIIEARCWKMLQYAIIRSACDSLMPMYDKPRQGKKREQPTFAERIDQLVIALSTQKALAKNALDPSNLIKLVDHPAKRLSQSQASIVSNRGRQRTLQDLKASKDDDEDGSKGVEKVDDPVGMDNEDEGQEDVSQPSKRRRTISTTTSNPALPLPAVNMPTFQLDPSVSNFVPSTAPAERGPHTLQPQSDSNSTLQLPRADPLPSSSGRVMPGTAQRGNMALRSSGQSPFLVSADTQPHQPPSLFDRQPFGSSFENLSAPSDDTSRNPWADPTLDAEDHSMSFFPPSLAGSNPSVGPPVSETIDPRLLIRTDRDGRPAQTFEEMNMSRSVPVGLRKRRQSNESVDQDPTGTRTSDFGAEEEDSL